MTDIDPARVATALLHAPAWARLGITEPEKELREAAAQELALAVTGLFADEPQPPDPDQLVLALWTCTTPATA